MSDPTSAPNPVDRLVQRRDRNEGSGIRTFVDDRISAPEPSAERDGDTFSETERIELIRQVVEIEQAESGECEAATESESHDDLSTEAERPGTPTPSDPDATTAEDEPRSGGLGEESTLPLPALEALSAKSTSSGPVDPEAPLVEDDFQLLEPLGAGGMGEVYRALQKSLRKSVALKVLKREALDSPSRVRRFLAEARALARLKHPQIVGVHGIGRMSDGRYFLVMDLMEGGETLHSLIKDGPVPFEQAAKLVATIAGAIEHAHSRGVIHRDLKPSNVLLDRNGEPHVTDFGLAKVFDTIDPDYPQTTADQILGTPHYMSPEQADPARGPITPRTDVYGLGGILFALLTGRPPLEGDSITQLIGQLVSLDPIRSPRELRPGIPLELEEICRKCLQKDAAQRYQSADEVVQSLEGWLVSPTLADGDLHSMDGDVGTQTAAPRGAWSTDRSLKDGRRRRSGHEWAARESPASRSLVSRFAKKSSTFLIAPLLIFGSLYVLMYTAWPTRGPGQPARDSHRMPGDLFQPHLSAASRPSLAHFAALGYSPLNLAELESEAKRRGLSLSLKYVDSRAAIAGLMMDEGHKPIYYAHSQGVYLPVGYRPENSNDTVNSMPRFLVRDSDQTRFVWISGGRFTQGDFRPYAPVEDLERNVCTPHEVVVSGFYLQETEVTNQEIERFQGSNPNVTLGEWKKVRDYLINELKKSPYEVNRGPAVCVSRRVAMEYAASVSGSLPTEAEWEFAARSRGLQQIWACKKNLGNGKPSAHLLDPLAPDQFPKPVQTLGEHDVTEQGIFDMTGSVREWCLEPYRPYDEILEGRKPDAGPLKDPGLSEEFEAVDPSTKYVVRGGSFQTPPDDAMTFQRGAAEPSTEAIDLGFRVILRCPRLPEKSAE